MAINSALDRKRTQAWSRSIYDAYPNAHGLWYASSMHANEPAILLYDRCQALLATRPTFSLALADPALDLTLASAARELGYIVG